MVVYCLLASPLEGKSGGYGSGIGPAKSQSQEVMFEPVYDLSEMEHREEQIYGILDELKELNEIHTDLNVLVAEQGVEWRHFFVVNLETVFLGS